MAFLIDFGDVYERLEACEGISQVSAVVTDALAVLGMTQFVYLCWSADTLSVEMSIHTYSEAWTSHYVAQGYDRIDPVIRMAFGAKKPFLWSAEDFSGDDEVDRFFEEADRFGLYSGVTVPLKTTAARRIFVTFAAPRGAKRLDAMRSQPAFMATVRFLAFALHRAVSRIQVGGVLLLTAREAGVLKMACVGLSAADIAAALGLSVDTINEVLARAARKLGQENRAGACHMMAGNFVKLQKPQ